MVFRFHIQLIAVLISSVFDSFSAVSVDVLLSVGKATSISNFMFLFLFVTRISGLFTVSLSVHVGISYRTVVYPFRLTVIAPYFDSLSGS